MPCSEGAIFPAHSLTIFTTLGLVFSREDSIATGRVDVCSICGVPKEPPQSTHVACRSQFADGQDEHVQTSLLHP
jgi:hypothetical protein